jgi:TfoX/Sxy family transcriptional regulator of competence genes
VTGGKVYFRTDAASRPDYLARGSVALQPKDRPRGPRTVDRNFLVPAEVLAEPDLLRQWAQRSAAVRD